MNHDVLVTIVHNPDERDAHCRLLVLFDETEYYYSGSAHYQHLLPFLAVKRISPVEGGVRVYGRDAREGLTCRLYCWSATEGRRGQVV